MVGVLHLGEEAEDGDGEEARRVEHGDGGRPCEVPELLRRVPGEAGRVQRCASNTIQERYMQQSSSREAEFLPFMAAG